MISIEFKDKGYEVTFPTDRIWARDLDELHAVLDHHLTLLHGWNNNDYCPLCRKARKGE
jgi:hypothetical protein